MKPFVYSILLMLLSVPVCAQTPDPAIKGRVVDGATGERIGFASVVLTDDDNHAVASASAIDGVFSIDRVSEGEFLLSVLLVGYQPYAVPVAIVGGRSLDLGTIALTPVETGLKEVVVTGERSRVVYKLDRQRINASASLASDGGTAADILASTPSVSIDAEGNLSFRGSSGFLVYVDGKQSPLEGTQALEQIAASNIEDIEIITTPSARYRSEGDIGIINIITRRHDDDGFSGAVNLAGSTIGMWNGDLLLNYRRGDSRWYVGAAGSEIRGKSDFDQQKTTIVDDFVTTSKADGRRHSNNSSYIGRMGWEFARKGHSLGLEAQAGMTRTARGGDMLYDEHRQQGDEVINDNVYDSHDRYSNEKHLAQLSGDYVWRLNERKDQIAAKWRLRYDWYALEYTESNMFEMSGERYEGTRGYESEHHWDIDGQASYELHYRPEGKAEVGYQYTSYSEHGDYNIKYWDRARRDFEWQENLYAPFYYRRQIHSAYLMVNDSFGPVSMDVGVRADHCIDEMTIEIEGASRYIRRTDLFPSAHVSYAAPDDNTFSLGYSYRTNRPGIWQLEPYITYEDYYTKMIGNPDIRPEYIHSAEIGYRKVFDKGHSVGVTGFYRHRSDVRERVRVAYEPGVTLDSLINAGNDRTWGVELSARIKNSRWWRMTINASLFDYKFVADYQGCTSSANTGYSASVINDFTVGRTTRLQFDANVVGPRVLTQGREDGYCYFDLAVRQQLLKNRLSASLVVNDVFRTARYNNYRISPTLNSTTHVRPLYPNIVLSLSFSFNAGGHKEHSGAVSSGAVFEGKDF